ncbi:hypothetical protein [Alteribacillus bidgolensis]|uniref:Uncharacterized protein n=1 Tax=Alteribacillus bidgolensis TaxID=930129 RepID=A0A1G8NLW7_9BACI|nr:hypothetical protein [Alteribacillus bidgolensis]SDI81259.1 hypothetical protein SAMN05216352_11277 [Alteribacillus bidgolensis]
MIYIILIFFIVPWITGFYLYKKAPKIFFTTAPITALIAITCNQLGIHLGIWEVNHMPTVMLLDSIFLDFGIFTLAGAWFTYFLYYKKLTRVWSYIWFVLGMTLLESITLLVEMVSYDESWNMFYTFLMYLGGFIIIDVVTQKLDKLRIFP